MNIRLACSALIAAVIDTQRAKEVGLSALSGAFTAFALYGTDISVLSVLGIGYIQFILYKIGRDAYRVYHLLQFMPKLAEELKKCFKKKGIKVEPKEKGDDSK